MALRLHPTARFRTLRHPLLRFTSKPRRVVVITVDVSSLALLIAIVFNFPLAVMGIATLLPWIPLLSSEVLWKYRHYGAFAILELLVIVQGLHFIEHIAQLIQVYVLGMARSQAHGIIGSLDVEYVHFCFVLLLQVGVTALLFKFPRNTALWVAFAIGLWHLVEHAYITYNYLFQNAYYQMQAKNGLLAQGGALLPHAPLPRIELHFLYNLLFLTALLWALIQCLRDVYDSYLQRSFPHLPRVELARLTPQMALVKAKPGDLLVRQGMPNDRCYILCQGEAEVIQEQEGQQSILKCLTKEQSFGVEPLLHGAATQSSVRAFTSCDLIALDGPIYQQIRDGKTVSNQQSPLV